ncbi:MAG: xylose isomerase [Blastopirellula sp.]|nr:MAG: xylose isomerase [Blastopirellula sp.]
MSESISRRGLLQYATLAGAGLMTANIAKPAAAKPTADEGHGIRFCFNTSTIRGQNLSIEDEIDVAGNAGYSGIEPWVRKIAQYQKDGGKLSDLRKRIADHGLTVESAIGFAQWIVDDEEKRKKGLEVAKHDMDLVAQIGGTRIAAPPSGNSEPGLDLFEVAKRYRALLELGDTMGVTPELELWGHSKNLSRLGEVAFVAMESGHPKACIMPDVYHVYRGGSDFNALRIIEGSAMPVFHMNDYPADPPRETINDSHRVYPGDGIAPLSQIIRDIHDRGFRGALSLELFNKEYWKQDPNAVAKVGLEKMQAEVQKALA